jgi:uncharacterized protein (DUF427 family)
MKTPGPDHPITVTKAAGHVTVRAGDDILVDTDRALVLRESTYPPVYYVPREDASMDRLQPSDHTTYCPYKGDASYLSIPVLGDRGKNAIWSYQTPYSAVADIAGHLAFYPDRVTIEDQER